MRYRFILILLLCLFSNILSLYQFLHNASILTTHTFLTLICKFTSKVFVTKKFIFASKKTFLPSRKHIPAKLQFARSVVKFKCFQTECVSNKSIENSSPFQWLSSRMEIFARVQILIRIDLIFI